MTKIERAKELRSCAEERAYHFRNRQLPYEEDSDAEAASAARRREEVELAELEVEMYSDLLKHYETKGV